ncbi:hypothetical protein [Acinetobacter tianfuensis]|uniref:Uncharacterized protein n=1 Tax=Acinetobacter tianfuensis TaxID=2419603 RepID=A0A3A8EST9_9GAMM|nr:hypothetical protein [Acinetobacter tianfuensis]RKG33770.1 hypothetical protein D7V32_02940 [Acinetobacter tianfuensis]
MSTRKIRSQLSKKGIPFMKIDMQRGNAYCETEWFVELTEGTKRDLIAASKGELSEDDFSYPGGNLENVFDFLESLPSLKEVS